MMIATKQLEKMNTNVSSSLRNCAENDAVLVCSNNKKYTRGSAFVTRERFSCSTQQMTMHENILKPLIIS